jgi:hypothetical protein
LLTRSIALFAYGPLLGALQRHCGKKLGSPNFYDFPFYGGTVFTTGRIVAGVPLELRSRGSFLLDNSDFPSRVGSIVLDDSLQINVLLPFLSSRGCTLDFSAVMLSGRGRNGKVIHQWYHGSWIITVASN